MLAGDHGEDCFRIWPAAFVDGPRSVGVEIVHGARRGRGSIDFGRLYASACKTLSPCSEQRRRSGSAKQHCRTAWKRKQVWISYCAALRMRRLRLACRERSTRTSKSRPSAFISSCNLAMVVLFKPPGWFAKLNQQMIQTIKRCCQCWIVILLRVLPADAICRQKTPRLVAQRRDHLGAAGIGMLQFHQQPLGAVQMIAQNHDHDALRSDAATLAGFVAAWFPATDLRLPVLP